MDAAEDRMWWYRALHTRLVAALADVHGGVLDAGCGTGGLLARLRAGRPDLDLVGLDWAEAACRRAAAKSGAQIVRGSANALPFADASFDAVIAADLLCHRAVDPDRALPELQPGPASGRPARRQHAGLRLAALGARPAGAQCPPPDRGPARHPATRGGISPGACALLERLAAAAHGGAAQGCWPATTPPRTSPRFRHGSMRCYMA